MKVGRKPRVTMYAAGLVAAITGCGIGTPGTPAAAPVSMTSGPTSTFEAPAQTSDDTSPATAPSPTSVAETSSVDTSLPEVGTSVPEEDRRSPQHETQGPPEWLDVQPPGRSDEFATELERAVAVLSDLGLRFQVGPGRGPVLPPPAQMRGSASAFAIFANNPDEELVSYAQILDDTESASGSDVSYIALQVSNVTDETRSLVQEKATTTVQGLPAVFGDDARANCPEIEEGGRDDTVLSWIDGDLKLELHVLPIPECETDAISRADVLDWANSLTWCSADSRSISNCVRPGAKP